MQKKVLGSPCKALGSLRCLPQRTRRERQLQSPEPLEPPLPLKLATPPSTALSCHPTPRSEPKEPHQCGHGLETVGYSGLEDRGSPVPATPRYLRYPYYLVPTNCIVLYNTILQGMVHTCRSCRNSSFSPTAGCRLTLQDIG